MGHTYQRVPVLLAPSRFGQWEARAETGREGNEGGDKGQVFYSLDSLPGRSPQFGCVLLPKANSTGVSSSEVQ